MEDTNAYARRHPAGRTSLTEATAAELARLQPRRIVIIGGEAAVSEQIAVEAAAYVR